MAVVARGPGSVDIAGNAQAGFGAMMGWLGDGRGSAPEDEAVRRVTGMGAGRHLSAGPRVANMREAELWAKLEVVLGKGYAGSWASTIALQELESRTVDEALAAGVPCKKIWRAVWVALELPGTMR